MNSQSSTIVQRVWNYCNVLRDDGISYGDYVEQLTYLLFLKMDYEGSTMLGKKSAIPAELNWSLLLPRDGEELEAHYLPILKDLGSGSGLIPTIFRKAQNKIQDPAKLKRLITLINGETWVGLDIDTKGEIYEGLLEKNAQIPKAAQGSTSHLVRLFRPWLKSCALNLVRPSVILPQEQAGSCSLRMIT